MNKVMDKLILKKIAKRWCKGILTMNDFDYEGSDEVLTQEEQDYIVAESVKIANRITEEDHFTDLEAGVKEYYEMKDA